VSKPTTSADGYVLLKPHQKLKLENGEVVWFMRHPKNVNRQEIRSIAIVTSPDRGLYEIHVGAISEILPDSAV
jgi:predicted DNA-binding antitoxin AbrB/MazE fold protein